MAATYLITSCKEAICEHDTEMYNVASCAPIQTMSFMFRQDKAKAHTASVWLHSRCNCLQFRPFAIMKHQIQKEDKGLLSSQNRISDENGKAFLP